MITFEIWLPQILGYCEFVSDDLKLRRAWINRDTSETSVTTFDELYEQIFDDLDSDLLQAELPIRLKSGDEMQQAICNFLEALRASDRARSMRSELMDAGTLLSSTPWKEVQNAARAACAAANKAVGRELGK